MSTAREPAQRAGGGWAKSGVRQGAKESCWGRQENLWRSHATTTSSLSTTQLKVTTNTMATTNTSRPIKRGATVPDLDNYKVARKDFDSSVMRRPLGDFANVQQQSDSDPTSWGVGLPPGPVTRSRTKLARLGTLARISPVPTVKVRKARRTVRSKVKATLPAVRDDCSKRMKQELAAVFGPVVTSVRPPDVTDVDEPYVGKDANFTPIYAQDIMNYLTFLETKWTCPANYLQNDPKVTPKMRAILMDWLIQVQYHESLEDETLHLCVALIDRFLAIQTVTPCSLQLLGITCLFIAAKVVERFPPEVLSLCHLTDDTYKVEDVLKWERDVLRMLDFGVNLPVPTVFLDRFLMVERGPEELRHLCYYLLDLSVTHVQFVQQRASVVAASAVYVGRAVLCPPPAWSSALAFYSHYPCPQLARCAAHLARALLRAKASKHQGARTKYSSENRYKNIANNTAITEHPVLHSIADSSSHAMEQ